jgi:polyphosphate kinase
MELIDREIAHAKVGREARMILKMNAITDVKTIEALYEASNAGVRIDMIVRGICSLRPGVKGMSENIRVTSIVGRFLEHSRIFFFLNGGESELYLSSADFMGRNLDHRVELMFPVADPEWAASIRKEVLETALLDTVGARVLGSDGKYARVGTLNGSERVDSQAILLQARHRSAGPKRALPKEAV